MNQKTSQDKPKFEIEYVVEDGTGFQQRSVKGLPIDTIGLGEQSFLLIDTGDDLLYIPVENIRSIHCNRILRGIIEDVPKEGLYQ